MTESAVDASAPTSSCSVLHPHAYRRMRILGRMPAERITVTVSPELAAAVRALASDSNRSVSSVVEEALADRLRHHALGQAIRAYEEEFGAFSDAELEAIAARKGLQRGTRRKAS